MTTKQFLARFNETVRGWKFDVASIGFPAPVRNGRILRNPKHLGKDWVDFNFARALGTPVRIVNDAAMIQPSRTGAGNPIEIASNVQSSTNDLS